jgi:nucleoside-diphosphate-sugar epimerase
VILVTGHRGYIGSRLSSSLIERGCSVIGIDLKDNKNILYHLSNIKEKVDTIFHLAAIPSVSYSVENPSYSLMQNVLGTSTVLEWAMKNNVNRVVFSSSAAIYGNGNGPTSPYGLHKLMSEKECKLYSDLYGLDVVCLRYFNVYSEDQEYGGAYSTVISAWMEMIRQGKDLRFEGDGQQTRDFIYIDDIVDANIFCMLYKDRFKAECFDIASGKTISLNMLRTMIEKYQNPKWIMKPERKGDVKYVSPDVSKINQIGWQAKIPIEKGIKKCFQNL